MPLENRIPSLRDTDLGHEDPILAERLDEPMRCRVLVVDDDDLVRARLCAMLSRAEYAVESAKSGEDALRIIALGTCHVVLTDWEMPEMDGPTLCQRLRGIHEEGYVYILMHTVRNRTCDLLEGLAAGADDFLVKGASLPEILARLEVARRITHVGNALRIANTENRRLSFVDPLTQAYNLRHVVRQMPRELNRARRYRHPLAILCCDIDKLAAINDRFGHVVGDEVLREFVLRCQSTLRDGSDWIARVGGDEFIVVLPETGTQGANEVKRKLNNLFANQPLRTPTCSVLISVSIGFTAVGKNQHRSAALRIEDLVRTANRRMCDDKRRSDGPVANPSVMNIRALA